MKNKNQTNYFYRCFLAVRLPNLNPASIPAGNTHSHTLSTSKSRELGRLIVNCISKKMANKAFFMSITTCPASLSDDTWTLGKYENIYIFSDKYQPHQKILTLIFPVLHAHSFKYICVVLSSFFMGFFFFNLKKSNCQILLIHLKLEI